MSSITALDQIGQPIKRDSIKKPNRYRVRYRTPDGASRSKTFKRKVDVDDFLISTEHSTRVGEYMDRCEGQVTFMTFARRGSAYRSDAVHSPGRPVVTLTPEAKKLLADVAE